ncbi:hypothetical protein HZF02_15570 [Pseudomonas yamanorum]|nr:hypothetical protein HZF02_15570 [Pseudomonas yamanorum]
MDIYNFLGAVASVCTIFWTYVSWVKTEDGTKEKIKAHIRKLGSRAAKTWAVIASLGASAANISKIVEFGTSTDPITRAEILSLLMYIWSSFFYGFAGLLVIGLWIKQVKDQRKAQITIDNLSIENPAEAGLDDRPREAG